MTGSVRTPEAPDRRVTAHFADVERAVAFMKGARCPAEAFVRALPLSDERECLLPICRFHTEDEGLLLTLATWREASADAFPTQFAVTLDGTRSWLADRVLAVPDRLLFLVLDRLGTPVGHIGIANAANERAEVEIDNVVRGLAEPTGIMSRALQALLGWIDDAIAPDAVFLRVFADNQHAISFYERNGFLATGEMPLRRHEEGGAVAYRPLTDDAEPDRVFLRMEPIAVSSPNRRVLTAGPSVTERERAYVLDAAALGWNEHAGAYLERFEAEFAEYVGVRYALATSSCTGALHIALAALGIGPGDEVVVPDLTWVATANAVAYVGAKPVFADVDPESWCLDPAAAEAAVTRRTKAIVAVHLYGHPTDMTALCALARSNGLALIEDAAPSIGAEWCGRRTGSFGDFAAFSFQGAKLCVTGEGGMLVTDDEDLYRRAHKLWDQGRRPGTFWIDEPGLKYKMSNMQAAFGLAQLQRVDGLIERKRRIHRWYAEAFAGLPSANLQTERPEARSIFWMTNLLLAEDAPISRDELRAALAIEEIDTRPVFPAISRYPVWGGEESPQPIAASIGERGVNLPSGVRLRRTDVERVASAVRRALACAR